MIPQFYQSHFQQHFTRAQYLILTLLLNLLQSEREVKLEQLAKLFPCPITVESRRRKLQRFLNLPQFTLSQIWYPLIVYWLTHYCQPGQLLSIVIDRTQWGYINLIMVSLVWEKRGIPICWTLLPKLGNSSLTEQQEILNEALPILANYKVVVLGDREFCSVDLANWLREKGVYFALRLKYSVCIETENQIWVALKDVGLVPGVSLYYRGVKVRKSQPVEGFDVACRWKRKYGGVSVKGPWFILTNLGGWSQAIAAYKKRMGIEEMFRDYKRGGYNLEGTGLKGQRLMVLILLIAMAYTMAVMHGMNLKQKAVKCYVVRRKESHRKYPRRSTFGSGLDSQKWLAYLEKYETLVEELMTLTPNKRSFYQKGLKAVAHIQSSS